MAQRKDSGVTEESVDMVIDEMVALLNSEPQGARVIQQLRQLQSEYLIAEGVRRVKIAAEDFTLEEVVEEFELNYSNVFSPTTIEAHSWRIEDLPLDFPMTPSLSDFIRTFLQ
jgi:hypothetical protein